MNYFLHKLILALGVWFLLGICMMVRFWYIFSKHGAKFPTWTHNQAQEEEPAFDKEYHQGFLEELAAANPDIPVGFAVRHTTRANNGQLNNNRANEENGAESCDTPLPKLVDLKFSNRHWQLADTSNGTFFAYRAYLDDREPGRTVVRILTMFDNESPAEAAFCQFWSEGAENPASVQVSLRCIVLADKDIHI